MRMATASAVLMRGLVENDAGYPARQVGHCLLPLAVHLPKHARQKLCWHGACAGRTVGAGTAGAGVQWAVNQHSVGWGARACPAMHVHCEQLTVTGR